MARIEEHRLPPFLLEAAKSAQPQRKKYGAPDPLSRCEDVLLSVSLPLGQNQVGHPAYSSLEYRGYQTSIYAASALGESSISFTYDKKSYELWNGSWGTVDKNITNFVTKFHDKNGNLDHPETTPHNPWPN